MRKGAEKKNRNKDRNTNMHQYYPLVGQRIFKDQEIKTFADISFARAASLNRVAVW